MEQGSEGPCDGEFVGKVIGYGKWDGPEAGAFFRDLLAEKP